MSFVLFKILLVAGLLVAVAITGWVLWKVVGTFSENLNEKIVTLLFLVPMGVAIFVYISVINDAVVVYTIDKPSYHKSEVVFDSSFRYGGKVYGLNEGGRYVLNVSDDVLIFYPQAYGNINTDDDEVVVIEGGEFAAICNSPDYYFGDEPSSISVDSHKRGEIRYCLDWLDDAL